MSSIWYTMPVVQKELRIIIDMIILILISSIIPEDVVQSSRVEKKEEPISKFHLFQHHLTIRNLI